MIPAAPLAPNSSEIVSKYFDGEVIIINLVTGAYYSLAGVGATIWKAIESGLTEAEILVAVSARFDVGPDTAAADLGRFLAELRAEQLVVESHAGPAPSPTPRAAPEFANRTGTDVTPYAPNFDPPAPYTAPALNAYRDMRDLLALDPPMPVLGEPAEWDTPQDK